MKEKIYISIIPFLIGITAFSQPPSWEWAKRAGGTSQDNSKSVTTDSFGNVYVIGVFASNSISFGSITLTNDTTDNSFDIFIVKYDETGNVVWAKRAGGPGSDIPHSISIDPSGNLYVAGGFSSSSITFGSTILIINNVGGTDMFILKYDNNGNELWAKTGTGGSSTDIAFSTTTDALGNVYVAGEFRSSTITFGATTLINQDTTNSTFDMFLIKYNASGNVLWAKREGGAIQDYATSIICDSSGNVFVTGNFSSPSITFGAYTLTRMGTNPTLDVFIVKYDSGGNPLWANSGGSGADDVFSTSITTDINGNVLVTGHFYSTSLTFGSTILPNTSVFLSDIFLVKYNTSGIMLWVKAEGGAASDGASSVVTDASGNVYVAGSFKSSTITIGTETLTNTDNTGNTADLFILKYDGAGNILWTKSFGGSGQDITGAITISASGNIFVAGEFRSSSIVFGSTTLTNAGGSFPGDMFIAKLGIDVWPGDTDNNNVVNNNDLLPIGLFYGQTGLQRASISNLWQNYISADWGQIEINGSDIKHVDSNGNGIIDSNDTLAINLNFNLAHVIPVNNDNFGERTAPDIYFITANNSYNAGDWINVEVWLGNSTDPVNNLYGLAFNINYNSSLVQTGTESITYPVSWLGTPGTNTLKIAKIDPAANTAYGAVTRINHTNVSGFGKIADFKFQLKTTIPSTSTMHFSISNYSANNATGVSQVFNKINDSIIVNAATVGIIEENTASEITISPNPFTFQTSITFSEEQNNCTLKILDVRGKEVKTINFTGKQVIIGKEEMEAGIYFLNIKTKHSTISKKLIIQ